MASTSTVLPIDLTHPDLTKPLKIHFPGPPRSAFAKRFLELTGDAATAERMDYCGRYSDKRDKNKHKKRQVQHCERAFCFRCATRRMHNTFERWEKTVEMSFICATHDIGGFTHTLIEASIPHPERSREAVEGEFKNVEDKLWDFMARNVEDSRGGSPRFDAVPCYDGLNAHMRVLYTSDDLSLGEWMSIFPSNASIRITYAPAIETLTLFRKLIAVEIPQDASDRAEQEALFSGMRRFRAHGIHIRNKGTDDLFATEEPTPSEVLANNSSKEVTEPAAHDHDLCAICGEPFDEQSQWFDPGSPEPRKEDYRWYPRRKNPPGQ